MDGSRNAESFTIVLLALILSREVLGLLL